MSSPNAQLSDVALSFLRKFAGQTFDLPVTGCTTAVVEYEPGDRFAAHTDIVSSISSTWDRTVSFSLLLSDPADFSGGELVVHGVTLPLAQGDFAGFTAATAHEVRPLTSGRRLVWIAFGELDR